MSYNIEMNINENGNYQACYLKTLWDLVEDKGEKMKLFNGYYIGTGDLTNGVRLQLPDYPKYGFYSIGAYKKK